MFCNKCGNELSTDSAFCNICGAPVGRENSAPEMSLEESIAFAEKLKTQYTGIERLTREISENESIISKPFRENTARYSFFRFFWKYLVIAGIAFVVLYFIMLILFATDAGAVAVFFALAMLITPIIILIVGGVKATNIRDEENMSIVNGNQRALEHRKELETRTASLKRDLATRKSQIVVDECSVPTSLRKASSMSQILTLLKSGKASNLNEAYKLLGK